MSSSSRQAKVKYRTWCKPATVAWITTATLLAKEIARSKGLDSRSKASANMVLGSAMRLYSRRLVSECRRSGLDPVAILAAHGKTLPSKFTGPPRSESGSLTRKRGKK